MLVTVLDGGGNPQKVVMSGQEIIADKSSTITAANVSQKAADQNSNRSGWRVVNTSNDVLGVNDLGNPAALTGAGAIVIQPGQMWPPVDWPLSTAQINIVGPVTGAPYIFREW